MVMLPIKLKGLKHTITCLQIFALTHTLDPWGGVKRSFFLSRKLSCLINGNEAKNTMQASILPLYTPTTPRRVKRSAIEIMQINIIILIELSEFLSDTQEWQDGLRCEKKCDLYFVVNILSL